MALTKQELEAINEDLQLALQQARTQNARLVNTLAKANESMRLLSEQYRKLETRYERLKQLLLSATQGTRPTRLSGMTMIEGRTTTDDRT